jgi:ATP-dependent DNA ligase
VFASVRGGVAEYPNATTIATAIRLLRIPEPLNHPESVFEPKIDGFRALAYVYGNRCRLVSRNGYEFKSWP